MLDYDFWGFKLFLSNAEELLTSCISSYVHYAKVQWRSYVYFLLHVFCKLLEEFFLSFETV